MARLFLLPHPPIGQVPLTLAFSILTSGVCTKPKQRTFLHQLLRFLHRRNHPTPMRLFQYRFPERRCSRHYKQCGCADLNTTAQVVTQDCESLGTSSALSASAIIQAGCGSTTCPPPPPSSGLSTGDIAGIVGGVIGGIALIVALVQLAATLNWISPRRAPSRLIQSLCCSCCTGGEKQTEDAGEGKPQPTRPEVGLQSTQRPHQEISSSYDSQWDTNTSNVIR